ncbi:FAD-binding oxidoreductase [Pseudonocardia xinjiangensis]|uniref:FAD-binding oxidoreductase n=1 Tax=Pseudonocardia xinjiangensis TaxID=75289 RepID=UPI003D8C3268
MPDDFTARALSAAEKLGPLLKGHVLLPADSGYDHAREIWNGGVEHRPALFVMCESTEDVQAAVRAARACGLPLSVRVGGHDWAGRALRHEGLVIDLTRMNVVEIDAGTRVAVVAGGATSADLAGAAADHGLAAVVGTVSMVGVAGFTLAGGYSPLSPRYGLALDNLVGVEVVLADGAVVTADESQNTDLFWALRGGGGNVGVVTSMRIRLHPVRTVLSGPIVFPWSQAEAVLRGHAVLAASAPDELGVVGAISSAPGGTPALLLAPVWSGDPAEGERVLARFAALGDPVVHQVRPMPFLDTFAPADARVVNGRHIDFRTRSLADLRPEAVAAIVAAVDARSSELSVISWQYLRGAAARVPVAATAFAQRSDHFMMQIIATWEPSQDPAPHEAWADGLSRALAPYSLPGGYPNVLGPEAADQIAEAYGANLPRLQRLKRELDPDGVFSATPLPA